MIIFLLLFCYYYCEVDEYKHCNGENFLLIRKNSHLPHPHFTLIKPHYFDIHAYGSLISKFIRYIVQLTSNEVDAT